MTYALKMAQAQFFMTAPASMEIASAAANTAGIAKDKIFLLEGSLSGYSTVHDLIRIGKEYGDQGQVPAFKISPGQKNKDLCGYLSFSSGTTGLPKAVCEEFKVMIYTNSSLGHDFAPKRNSTMSTSSIQRSPEHHPYIGCATIVPQLVQTRLSYVQVNRTNTTPTSHWSRPPTSSASPPKRRSANDTSIHDGIHALRHRKAPAHRDPPRAPNPSSHGARPRHIEVRHIFRDATFVRRGAAIGRTDRAASCQVSTHG